MDQCYLVKVSYALYTNTFMVRTNDPIEAVKTAKKIYEQETDGSYGSTPTISMTPYDVHPVSKA